jgi:hypothetical protein
MSRVDAICTVLATEAEVLNPIDATQDMVYRLLISRSVEHWRGIKLGCYDLKVKGLCGSIVEIRLGEQHHDGWYDCLVYVNWDIPAYLMCDAPTECPIRFCIAREPEGEIEVYWQINAREADLTIVEQANTSQYRPSLSLPSAYTHLLHPPTLDPSDLIV